MSGLPAPNETAKVAPNDQRNKDACQYAVGLSEKFLTLSAAGIAFIIGLVFAKEDSAAVQLSPNVLRWALALFGMSVFLGWLFLMNVVGSVADDDYRVQNNAKQWLCLLQIITALFGIGLLAYCTFNAVGEPSRKKKSPCLVQMRLPEASSVVSTALTAASPRFSQQFSILYSPSSSLPTIVREVGSGSTESRPPNNPQFSILNFSS
jgi:hypothetical protein